MRKRRMIGVLIASLPYPPAAADFHETFDTLAVSPQWVQPESWHAVNWVPAANALEVSRSRTMVLGKDSQGKTRLDLNGKKILGTAGTYMPDRSVFLEKGVNLETEQLEQFEFGVTPNSSSRKVTLFVDDVFVGGGTSSALMKIRTRRDGVRGIPQPMALQRGWKNHHGCDANGRFIPNPSLRDPAFVKERKQP